MARVQVAGSGTPTGATSEFFLNLPELKNANAKYPPAEGPLAAVTPGNAGGLMLMLAEFGTLSLKQVLAPAMQMADGYPVEEEFVRKIEKEKEKLKKWPYSKRVFFPHLGDVEVPLDEDNAAAHHTHVWTQQNTNTVTERSQNLCRRLNATLVVDSAHSISRCLEPFISVISV